MMTATISAELFKLRTIRTPWIVAVVVTAAVVAVLGLNAAFLGDPGQPALVPATLGDLVRFPGRLAGGAALLFGLLMSTAEYRHRSILTTRLAQQRPLRLVLGKAAAAALAGGLLAAAMTAIALGGSTILFAARDVAYQPLQHGIPAAVASLLIVAALHAVAGVGVGELLRNPALAVGAVLGWVFVVEGVVPVLLQEPGLARWLPNGAVSAALAAGLPANAAYVAPVAGLVLLAAYAVGMLAAGLARARYTDA
jgi:ABC-2 type transport system permease protein